MGKTTTYGRTHCWYAVKDRSGRYLTREGTYSKMLRKAQSFHSKIEANNALSADKPTTVVRICQAITLYESD